MSLKPPSPKTGKAGLKKFQEAIELHQSSLTNKFAREFHRKDLSRWQKLYATLAKQREEGSQSALHFDQLSKLCGDMLAAYGMEPPAIKRTPKKYTPATLKYPSFPDKITHKLHFLEGPSPRRQRAINLIKHAPFLSRQVSGKGRVLVSVGTSKNDVRFYERLVETLNGLLAGDLTKAGFDIGYEMRPVGIPEGRSWSPNPLDPNLPIARIRDDNNKARGYTWQARALGDEYIGGDGKGLPTDIIIDQIDTVWDPDQTWNNVLELTSNNRLIEAMAIVDAIPGTEREILFDEVIYLRFLNKAKLTADDVRHIARKYVHGSVISSRLIDEFESFIDAVQGTFDDDPPMLEQLSRLKPDFGERMIPPMPPASDWSALQKHQSLFTNPSNPRGRIFSFNIQISLSNIEELLASYLIDAENMFRRERSIPEIGKGWASELALLDLVQTIWPSAIHQWRPAFLGLQSIDIFIPDIKLAIEYQGQQHYEAVSLFGGELGFEATKARDERKRILLDSNEIPLLEWPYHVAITLDELKRSITNLGIEIPI